MLTIQSRAALTYSANVMATPARHYRSSTSSAVHCNQCRRKLCQTRLSTSLNTLKTPLNSLTWRRFATEEDSEAFHSLGTLLTHPNGFDSDLQLAMMVESILAAFGALTCVSLDKVRKGQFFDGSIIFIYD